ncbi:MAG: cytosine deaminase [Oscillatoriales cyanobacterium SM2_2_1]|nr:cytosine deaminase [Oscillatoriales cyanobacterium SM2_2_1]
MLGSPDGDCIVAHPPYWIRRGRVPRCLLPPFLAGEDPVPLLDLRIDHGLVVELLPHGVAPDLDNVPDQDIDQQGGWILPALADLHTHLDKAHTWDRSPNLDGTFAGAIAAVERDRPNWSHDDLYCRMDYSLGMAYYHGMAALRTHLDCPPEHMALTLEVFLELQQHWRDRLVLEAVSLVTLDQYFTPAGVALADRLAEIGGILGGVAYPHPELDAQLDRVFQLAQDRQLRLDFHADETGDPQSNALERIAAAALRHGYTDPIVCGHCCVLAVQDHATVNHTLDLVQSCDLTVVSLPLCNLFLQDRQAGRTPRWRGVTLVHELQARGIPVAIASDNCDDPFYAYGEHDLIATYQLSSQITHLDLYPHQSIPTITSVPSRHLGTTGTFYSGMAADLMLFSATSHRELIARSQGDRTILRGGIRQERHLPAPLSRHHPV